MGNGVGGSSHRRHNRLAFTLLDLLIAAGVVAILLQLLLPLLQLTRERARQAECVGNVQRLVQGALLHVESHSHFPAGGWSWEWVGDPTRGYGLEQPGGWIFNVLPFVDAQQIHDYALVENPVERHVRLGIMVQQVTPGFNCPSRRSPGPFGGSPFDKVHGTKNADHAYRAARSDYAVNGGSIYTTLWPGPDSYEHEAGESYEWPEDFLAANGIGYCQSTVTPTDVTRGLSRTYYCGEKYLNPKHYQNGLDAGDDFTMYQGDDMDIARWTMSTITHEYKKLVDYPNMPRRDNEQFFSSYAFGSVHAKYWHAGFCDGTVKRMAYELDPVVHAACGNRHE